MIPLASARGRFVWHELMTTDIPAAIAFYGRALGLTTESFPGEKPYSMWKTPAGHLIGGVFDLPEDARKMGAPPAWMGNICVADVDAAAALVPKLGGTVFHGPFDVPGVGRVAVVADPGMATIGLFQPEGDAPGHDGPAEAGDVTWNELYSTAPDTAWAFYEAVSGWKKTDAMDMGPMGTYQMYGPAQGGTLGGIMKSPPDMPFSAWNFYFHVSDLGAAIERATGAGAKLVNGPMQVPGGDFVATLLDPQGAMFSLHARQHG